MKSLMGMISENVKNDAFVQLIEYVDGKVVVRDPQGPFSATYEDALVYQRIINTYLAQGKDGIDALCKAEWDEYHEEERKEDEQQNLKYYDFVYAQGKKHDREGYAYVIKMLDGKHKGLFKIGSTVASLEKALKENQKRNGNCEVVLSGMFDHCKQTQREWQGLMVSKAEHNADWFKLDEDDIQLIANCYFEL